MNGAGSAVIVEKHPGTARRLVANEEAIFAGLPRQGDAAFFHAAQYLAAAEE